MSIISKILKNRELKRELKEAQEDKEHQRYIDSTIRFAQLLSDNYSQTQALEIINILHNKDLFVAYLLCSRKQ